MLRGLGDRRLRSFGIFLVVAFLAPLLVLSVFWFVRSTQRFLGDPGQWGETSFTTPAQQPVVAATAGPPCPSRLAGNVVVASCPTGSRLAQLLGLRIAAPATFEQVLGSVVPDQALAPAAGAPVTALTCTVFGQPVR